MMPLSAIRSTRGVCNEAFSSVFASDGLNYILDVGANHGTQAGVVAATLLSLFCTFLAEGELATVEALPKDF